MPTKPGLSRRQCKTGARYDKKKVLLVTTRAHGLHAELPSNNAHYTFPMIAVSALDESA